MKILPSFLRMSLKVACKIRFKKRSGYYKKLWQEIKNKEQKVGKKPWQLTISTTEKILVEFQNNWLCYNNHRHISMISVINYPCFQTSVHIFTFCSQTSNLEYQHTGVHNRWRKYGTIKTLLKATNVPLYYHHSRYV